MYDSYEGVFVQVFSAIYCILEKQISHLLQLRSFNIETDCGTYR